MGDGVLENQKNPEVQVDPSKKEPMIEEQVDQLKKITTMIINATLDSGNVAWVDLQSMYFLPIRFQT